MSITQPDFRTTTVYDAGDFDRARLSPDGPSLDAPSAGEAARDAAMDAAARRERAERDRAARQRGEYVPSDAMRAAASACRISLSQRGLHTLDADVHREGVLSVSPQRGHAAAPTMDATVEALCAIYGDDAEVAAGDRVVWVRIIRTAFADPFVVDGVAQDNPPF